MKALDQSDELARRSDKLRARSERIRGAADEQMAHSRRLIAAAAGPHGAVRQARVPGDVPIVDAAPRGTPSAPDAQGPGAMRPETEALVRMAQEARARARATRAQVARGRSQRQVLHDSAFARLQAKQETMAVIEQAKGIIIAQWRCRPEEAFDLLRRASQRTNIKVHTLAAQIVEQAACSNNSGNVTPIALGTTRFSQTWTQPIAQPRPAGSDGVTVTPGPAG